MRKAVTLAIIFISLSVFANSQFRYVKPELMVPVGHNIYINSAEFSPDGKYIVTASDNTAKLWEAESGKLLHDLTGHTDNVASAEFSPDGKYIVTASWDGTAKVWEAESGELKHNIVIHKNRVNSAKFSPDGKYILTIESNETAFLWEVDTGKLVYDLTEKAGFIDKALFSPDGKYIVTYESLSETAFLWEVETGQLIYDFHRFCIESVSFRSNSKNIIIGSRDDNAIVWSIKNMKVIHNMMGHSNTVNTAENSPDGKYVVTASSDGTVKIWDIKTGNFICNLLEHKYAVNSAHYSQDGKYVITSISDGTVKIWEVENRQLIYSYVGYTSGLNNSADFSSNAKYIIIKGSFDGTAFLLEVGRSKMMNFSTNSRSIKCVSFSPDGKYIATASSDNSAKIWSTENGSIVQNLIGHTEDVNTAEFSPSGKYIVTASSDNSAKIWSTENGSIVQNLIGHTEDVNTAEFSPSGKYIVTASSDNSAKIWDVKTGQPIQNLIGKNYVSCASFNQTDEFIITGYWGGIISLWDISTGNRVCDLFRHFAKVFSISMSKDGRYIVTGSNDNIAKVWNMQSRRLVCDLVGHSNYIKSVEFSKDGKYIVTASSDNTAKLWEAESGKLLHDLTGHTDNVASAEFSPDGKYIVTASEDSKIKLWSTETGKDLITIIPIDSTDWVHIVPSGHFDASEGAMEKMYYVAGLKTIDLGQFKDVYYVPGLYKKVMGYDDESLNFKTRLDSIALFPDVENLSVNADDLTVKFDLINQGGGYGKVGVWIDGKYVTLDAREVYERMWVDDIEVENYPPNYFDTLMAEKVTMEVKLEEKYLTPGEENLIEVAAYNAMQDVISRRAAITLQAPDDLMADKYAEKGQAMGTKKKKRSDFPDYYCVFIGVSDYNGTDLDLKFAASDAIAMKKAVELAANNLISPLGYSVNTYLLTTDSTEKYAEPSKENIIRLLDSLENVVLPTDMLFVYLSGHGSNKDNEFYFLTNEATNFADLDNHRLKEEVSISSAELMSKINDIPAKKQILILDACAAGKLVESQDMFVSRSIPYSQAKAMERLKDRTGMYVLCGSAADQSSYEANKYNMGLMTYSLLHGLKGEALRDGKYVDVQDWFKYAHNKTPEYAQGIGGIQQPIMAIPRGNAASFEIGLIEDKDKELIPVPDEKPVIIRSAFYNPNKGRDDLYLARKLNDELYELSSRGSRSHISYIDTDSYPGSYMVSGEYRVEGGVIYLKSRIFYDEEQLKEFELQAPEDQVDELIKQIRRKLNDTLNERRKN
jgi:WD40 repeat protein